MSSLPRSRERGAQRQVSVRPDFLHASLRLLQRNIVAPRLNTAAPPRVNTAMAVPQVAGETTWWGRPRRSAPAWRPFAPPHAAMNDRKHLARRHPPRRCKPEPSRPRRTPPSNNAPRRNRGACVEMVTLVRSGVQLEGRSALATTPTEYDKNTDICTTFHDIESCFPGAASRPAYLRHPGTPYPTPNTAFPDADRSPEASRSDAGETPAHRVHVRCDPGPPRAVRPAHRRSALRARSSARYYWGCVASPGLSLPRTSGAVEHALQILHELSLPNGEHQRAGQVRLARPLAPFR